MATPRPIPNDVWQPLGLHLVNINAYAKFYQNIPNSLRVIDIFHEQAGDKIFTNRPGTKSNDYRALYEIQRSVSVDLLRVVQLHPEELAYFKRYLDNPRNLLKICRDVLRSHYKGRGIYKYIHTNGEYSSQSGRLYFSQVISMSLKISLYILGCYLEKCCNTLSSKRFIPFKNMILVLYQLAAIDVLFRQAGGQVYKVDLRLIFVTVKVSSRVKEHLFSVTDAAKSVLIWVVDSQK